ADSRAHIGLFRSVSIKPNEKECAGALGSSATSIHALDAGVMEFARKTGRAVFCTCGERGILVAEGAHVPIRVPAYPVAGPIDIVGAGDSSSAAIASAVAAGASLVDAADFGNLVASITIQQIGKTGTATPEQVRHRWEEVSPRGRG